MKTNRYVAYFRVSTQKQGRSGLGLEAQQSAVQDYLNTYGGEVIATGIGAGEIRIEWGLYLFTGTVLASLVILLADNRYRPIIMTLPEPPSR